MPHKADKFIRHISGPFATVRTCTICGFSDKFPRGSGRGYGMREGNKSRGRLIQHVKQCHPEALKENTK